MPPWEKYQQPAPATSGGKPWERYGKPKEAPRTYTAQQMADELSLPIPGTDWRTPEQPVRYQSPIPGGDFMNEAARSFAENIPVVGPLVDGAAQATGAQLTSMIPGVDMTPEELQQQRDILRSRDASGQPVANMAGTVAGTVGPLMALGQTQMGGRALGITGPMWQRILAGGASGGALTAADLAARGESTSGEIGGQALLGAGIGSAFPLVDRPVAALARMLAGESAPASVRSVARNLERAGIEPSAIPQRMSELGPDGMLLDLDPNLTRQGAAIASLPGEGQTTLSNAMTTRQQGANARIQGDVNATLGPATSPTQFNQGIRTQQQALSPQYEAAFANASPVDTSAIAGRLDSLGTTAVGEIQSAVGKVRNMLADPQTGQLSSDPRRLMSIRQELDDMIGGSQGNLKRILTDIRKSVDEELGRAVPGIKDVDQQFSLLAQQRTGFEQGQQALDSGRTALTPVDLQALADASPQEVLSAMSQGARAEIDRLIGTTANNINSLKTALKGDGSWNRDRLVTLFGQDKADKLLSVLEREQTFANSFQKIMGNSETAARTAAQKEAEPTKFNLELGRMLTAIPQGAANLGARARSEAVNAQIADMLTSGGSPELVDQLIKARKLGQGLLGSSPALLLTNQ